MHAGLLVVLGMALAACTASETATAPAVDRADALPAASLSVLGEDRTVDTASWTGTPTVVNFWATWCAFCVEEMPDIQAVAADFGADLRVVGVDREDRVEEAVEYARRIGVTYDLVEDPDGSFFRAVGGRGMPTTVLVDASGEMVYTHSGPLTEQRLRELIDEHLGLSN